MSRTGCCIPRIMALGLVVALFAGTAQAQDMARERQAMVDEVAAMARAFDGGAEKGAIDPRVLAALGRVLRHEFVPLLSRGSAYDNRPCRSATARPSRNPTSSPAATAVPR